MESLCDRTVHEVMTGNVITLPEDLPLREAARILSRAQISGAPVVDRQSKCIGVLSTTDFLRWATDRTGNAAIIARAQFGVPVEWQMLPPEEIPADPVRKHMTGDVVTIGPDSSIRHAARLMLDAHIHRLIVADADNRPIGILTSTNILAAVAYAEHCPQAELVP
jgi:CBS domain-containing protein